MALVLSPSWRRPDGTWRFVVEEVAEKGLHLAFVQRRVLQGLKPALI
jgi:hypothetical protein